jgi:hypothetical protein
MVPADEALEITIEVEGGKALEPVLHAYPASGTHSKIPMREAGPNRFQASLPIEKSMLQYRIRAGDSLTRKYQLEPHARPKVVVFSRTYHFPEYTGLPDHTDTSPDGAITGLEGSTVDLVLQTDQPVSSGSLGLTRGKQSEELRANIGSPDSRVLSSAFALTESGVYTARLVSLETGLRSAAGPQHSIRVELDAPPTVSLDVPVQDVVVPLGEKVALAGHAEDDFGLVEVSHEFQVNKGRWQSIQLKANAGKHDDIRCFSDPLQSGA